MSILSQITITDTLLSTSMDDNKEIYRTLHDTIISKRWHSPHVIRREAHHAQYQAFIECVPAGSTVIDAGCGEGVLSVLLAKHGCRIIGIDISEPNIAAAQELARQEGVADRCQFMVGDAEHLPVADESADVAVSSHVLEHIPDFVQGVRELNRVAKTLVIVAIPTCLNPASWVLLGNDRYWTISRRTPYAMIVGIMRVLVAYVSGQEGVNETYAGHAELIHIHRFPSRGKQLLTNGGLSVSRYRASSFPIPYIPFLVPLSKLLHTCRYWPIIRNWGYGTTYVCHPTHARGS